MAVGRIVQISVAPTGVGNDWLAIWRLLLLKSLCQGLPWHSLGVVRRQGE